MIIILFEIQNYKKYCQYNLSVFSVCFGEIERSVFSIWKDCNKYIVNILFIEFKIGY